MHDPLDAYLEHLRRERQVSPHTLDGYRRDLLKVLALCEKNTIAHWSDLDGRSLRVGERALTLATAGATVERQAPDWRARLLAARLFRY